MDCLRSRKLWLPLVIIALFLTACTGGGSKPTPVQYFSVSGFVDDDDGNPIPDVTIAFEGEVSDETNTLGSGYYELTGLKGLTTISASKDGWVFPEEKTVDKTSTVNFTGTKKTYPLTGTISVKHNFPRSIVDNSTGIAASHASPRIESTSRQTSTMNESESDEIIISFHAGLPEEERMDVLNSLGYEVIDSLSILNAYLVRPMGHTQEYPIYRAMSIPGVRYAEPNRHVRQLSVTYPEDPLFPNQWHYPLIRLPQAWSVTTGDSSIRIAVIDSGVKKDHPDLASQLDSANGYNFVDSNRDFDDNNGHGTHVAGTIGATTNNSLGVAGVMWDVDILPIKVMNSEGTGNAWDISHGILYAAGLLDKSDIPRNPKPADLINLSMGTDEDDSLMKEAVEQVLNDTDSLIIAASGNDYGGPVLYPAAYPGVVAVGAVDYNYPYTPNVAHYSNVGYELDVVAPGGDLSIDTDRDGYLDGVLSTSASSQYYNEHMQGTSMAAPHVTGVIGLMLAAGIPPERINDILRQTSMPLGPEEFSDSYGHGLINAYWAVNAVDTMRIILGIREGNTINVVAETAINSRGGDFAFKEIPPGDYQVFAWVDVQVGTNMVEAGDYFSETEVIHFEENKTYEITGTTTEIGFVDQVGKSLDYSNAKRLYSH